MKIIMHGVYPRRTPVYVDTQHIFSIATINESLHCAALNMAKTSPSQEFNDKRIEQALNMKDTRRASAADWSLVASKNIYMPKVIPAEVSRNTIAEALTGKQEVVLLAWMIRQDSKY